MSLVRGVVRFASSALLDPADSVPRRRDADQDTWRSRARDSASRPRLAADKIPMNPLDDQRPMRTDLPNDRRGHRAATCAYTGDPAAALPDTTRPVLGGRPPRTDTGCRAPSIAEPVVVGFVSRALTGTPGDAPRHDHGPEPRVPLLIAAPSRSPGTDAARSAGSASPSISRRRVREESNPPKAARVRRGRRSKSHPSIWRSRHRGVPHPRPELDRNGRRPPPRNLGPAPDGPVCFGQGPPVPRSPHP